MNNGCFKLHKAQARARSFAEPECPGDYGPALVTDWNKVVCIAYTDINVYV